MERAIQIRDETIRLGQLLKLVGIIDSGSEAKEFLVSQLVLVNEQRETRRGRQLRAGDTVRIGEQQLLVSAPS